MIRSLLKKKLFPEPKGNKTCPICKNNETYLSNLPINYFKSMQENGFIHSIFMFETLNIIEYSCSKCGGADRDRLYAIYLNKYFAEKNQNISLLDIAPSKSLAAFLKSFKNITYRSTDLYMDNVDDKQDITDMNLYEDNRFDFIICSHVLEHIPDDNKAISEIYRVMKPGGKGIMMAPINLGLKEITEDINCDDIPTRWKKFGQDDHIRLYSKQGFVERLENSGFRVYQLGIDYFGDKVFKDNSITHTSVLYIVEKPV